MVFTAHRSTVVRWIALLGTPVLSLVAFLVAYWLDPLNFGDQQPIAAIPALFLAIVVLLIGHTITTVQELQTTSVYSTRIYDAVRTYLHVTRVGSPEQAFRYISSRVPVLREVKNTSFNIKSETERADEKLYDTDVYLGTTSQIAMYCNKNLIWKDIGDPIGLTRLRTLQERCDKASRGKRSGYRYKLISHHEPQINFIILEYVDGAREVLFNWDFRGTGQDPTVLLSRDRDILDMFSIQFAMLWSHASPDHDNHPTKSTSIK